MKIVLERDYKAPEFTLGKLYVPGKIELFTCEDKVREIAGVPVEEWKVPGSTAIPRGIYRVIVTFSRRFRNHLPLLLDVPGFSGIRIHAGNTSSDTAGCILVGAGRTKEGVSKSRFAMEVLMNQIEPIIGTSEIITLEVKDAK